uniref:Secreted protein n=2 Tax=Bursaphelenchus xylophilus TaxID=6326 RepID=A0A1I7SIN5_BURXY
MRASTAFPTACAAAKQRENGPSTSGSQSRPSTSRPNHPPRMSLRILPVKAGGGSKVTPRSTVRHYKADVS